MNKIFKSFLMLSIFSTLGAPQIIFAQMPKTIPWDVPSIQRFYGDCGYRSQKVNMDVMPRICNFKIECYKESSEYPISTYIGNCTALNNKCPNPAYSCMAEAANKRKLVAETQNSTTTKSSRPSTPKGPSGVDSPHK